MMREHPIEGLMSAAMISIQDMVDVNTIIGDPIEIDGGIVIIPISKVCFGFAAGGSEFSEETIDEYNKKDREEKVQYKLPFGGGSGAGVSINPVAFIIVQEKNVKLLPVNHSSAVDKLLDYVPDLFDKVNEIMCKKVKENYSEKIKEVIKQEVPNEEKKKENKQENKKEDKVDYTYEFEYEEKEDD